MNEYEWTIGEESGIAELSPEQTVAVLRAFMNDEESWSTAQKDRKSVV